MLFTILTSFNKVAVLTRLVDYDLPLTADPFFLLLLEVDKNSNQ